MKNGLLLGFVFMLSGCLFSTPKSDFYLLESASKTEVVSQKVLKISVQDVTLPDYLLRPQIVLKKNDSSEIDISEFHRWASDLPEMIQNVLISDLKKAFPRSEIKPLLFGDGSKYVVKVDLEKMTGAFKNEAVLGGTWQILTPRGKVLKQNSFEFEGKVDKTYGSYVNAQGSLLKRLSVEIAQNLSNL